MTKFLPVAHDTNSYEILKLSEKPLDTYEKARAIIEADFSETLRKWGVPEEEIYLEDYYSEDFHFKHGLFEVGGGFIYIEGDEIDYDILIWEE